MGHSIVSKACFEPFNAIVRNAGKSPEAIRQMIPSNDDAGYDARNDEFVNMFDAGIIDPAKVTLTALELAASAAGTLLTTECVVGINPEAEEEEKKPQYMM
jgi:chaperonin GroEL